MAIKIRKTRALGVGEDDEPAPSGGRSGRLDAFAAPLYGLAGEAVRRRVRGGRRVLVPPSGEPDPRLLRFTSPNATFTRSSDGTYLTEEPNSAGGFMATAGSHVIRTETWRKSESLGLYLLEGAATQELASPDDLTAGDWIATQVDGPDGVQASATITGPDGGTAYEIDFAADANDRLIQLVTAASLTDNANYTASVWVRTLSGSETVRLGIPLKSGGTSLGGDHTITTTWKRIDLTADVGTGSTNSFFRIQNGSDGAARKIVAALPNFVEASYPTSTILSQSTRAADVLTFAGIPASMATGAWKFTFVPLFAQDEGFDAGIKPRLWQNTDTTSEAIELDRNAGGMRVRGFDVDTTVAMSNITFARYTQMELTVDMDDELVISGADSGDGSTSATGLEWTEGDALQVASNAAGTVPFNGLIEEPVAA